MYIRKVTHRNKKNHQEYFTFKLVESVRTEQGPRQQELLNLGTDFNLPVEEWKDLTLRIKEIMTGQQSILTYTPVVETLARSCARKIIRKQSSVVPEGQSLPDYHTVDINSVENEDVRSVGAEHVVYETMKELELDKKMEELMFSKVEIDTALGVIAGKLINPSSERKTHKWLKDISAIDELMDTDFNTLSHYRVYKVSDTLLKNKEAIENHLRLQECNLFGLEEKIILYDLTNTFFEGTGKYNKKARNARSKEKRSDCPLITLGLVLDAQGFPKASNIFDGNISEPSTLETMIKKLAGEEDFIKPTIVLDAGIATEDNIKWLKENEYFYLVVSRKKKREIPPGVQMVPIKTRNTPVQAGILNNEETDEIELYCHSEGKEKKEEQIKTFFQERFEEELKKVNISLSKKNGIKRLDKVIERIGRLKERFKRVAYHYDVSIKKDLETNKAVDISWHLKDREKTEGVYVLRTNRKELKEEQIWNIHNMLTDIEDAFRCMKSELGLRPIYHKKEERGDGHIFITVLAYHILHFVRMKLRQNEIYLSWSTIRERLSTHARITTTFKRKDGKMVHIRKSSTANLFHKKIYSALNISCQPGKTLKTIL